MAYSNNFSRIKDPSELIGKPALLLKNGDWKLGKVKGLTTSSNGETVAIFEENPSKSPLKRACKSALQFVGVASSVKTVSISRLHPLSEISISEPKPVANPAKICSGFETDIHWKRVRLYQFLMEDLKRGESVIWLPRSGTSGPQETLNIGVVRETYGQEDSVDTSLSSRSQQFYAKVEFDGEPRMNSERKPYAFSQTADGRLTRFSYVNTNELMKLGSYFEHFTEEQNSDATNKPITEIENGVDTQLESRSISVDICRRCKIPMGHDIKDGEISIGQSIYFVPEEIMGVVRRTLKDEDGRIWVEIRFARDLDLPEVQHSSNCEADRIVCVTCLVIDAKLLQCDPKSSFFILVEDTHKVSGSSVINLDRSNASTKSSTLLETNMDMDYESGGTNAHSKSWVDANLHKIIGQSQQLMGIQGELNSCYLDSSLFAMFAFTNLFDDLLLQNRGEYKSLPHLLNVVVDTLRTDFFVPSEITMALRGLLHDSCDKSYLSSFVDVEEFLLTLFDQMEVKNFYKLDNGAEDRIHQIVVPIEEGQSEDIPLKGTSDLLADSLTFNQVHFVERPSPALILKLPYCNGRPLYGSQFVLPNLQISILTESTYKLDLFAILCLHHNHYVCFTKAGDELLSPWVYLDSNPTQKLPKVDLLQNLGSDLLNVESDPGTILNKNNGNTLNHPQAMKYILRATYICLYK